MPKPPAG